MTRFTELRSRIVAVPGLAGHVGVIVGGVTLGLIALTIILTSQQFIWPWADRYEFQATFSEAPGIAPGQGQEVRIAGVPSGWITAAEVDDRGRAVLTLSLDHAQAPVHRDARLVLRPKSPLNEMYIELAPGTTEAGELDPGEVLPVTNSVRPIQIEEPLGHLDAEARTALRSLLSEADVALAEGSAHLPDGIDQLATTVESLHPVMVALERRSGLLRSLVSDLADVGTAASGGDERLARLVAAADTTVRTLAERDDDLRATLAELPDVVEQLQRSAGAVGELSDRLDPTLRDLATASGRLPDALDEVGLLVEQADRTVGLLGPVLVEARPLLADLRPLSTDMREAAEDLASLSPNLDPLTATAAARMGDLLPFVYNTQSLTSTEDAHGPIFRGLVGFDTSSVSTGVAELDRLLAELPVGAEARS